MPAHYQNLPILYNHYTSQSWAEKKKDHDWTIMLKYLANPEHYRTKDNINIYVNFVKISEYAQYKCKKKGKPYPCNSLEISMFKSSYISTIDGDLTIIDFSDINNNVEYVQ
ncbi:hypothetical protein RhiirC2_802553 [Rhizophagus irregularis]|uniref:Uncharacterized protein n=1 Tax=Rhizophagus irregularis TaxID=588596 RepID=A0A2N1M197_9GLOM|nr:hypothetical protein RhiirC2_802553 [Rhizophagus irregularis]